MRMAGKITDHRTCFGGSWRATLALAMLAGLSFAGLFLAERASARPLVPAERRYDPYASNLPACDDPAVFERIQGRFHDAEVEYWKSGLEILGFESVTQIGYRSIGLDYIPRRYCVASVVMNDTKIRKVSYSVGEDLGIIGIGFGVEWCIAGLDRHDAYAPNCKMARP